MLSIYTKHLRNLFTREEYMTITRTHRDKIRYYLRTYYTVDEFRNLFSTFYAYDVVLDVLQNLENVTQEEIDAVKTARQRMQDMIDRSQRMRQYRQISR